LSVLIERKGRMDDRTGELVSLAEVLQKTQKERKHFVEIPNALLPQIEGMNRKQRRKWLKENRKMTEPLKEQSRMIAKELSWKPTETVEISVGG